MKVAGDLAAANVPVLVDADSNIPHTFAWLGARQDNAALLARAGVTVVIAEMNGGAPAGAAADNAAFRAVTLGPAELYGVADRIGSLAPGKDAPIVIWSGDPFELYTGAEKVFVRGKEVERPSRQDELMRRYKGLAPDYLHTPR